MVAYPRNITFEQMPATDRALTEEVWAQLLDINKRAVTEGYQDNPSLLAHPDLQLEMGGDGLQAYVDRRRHPTVTANNPHQEQLLQNPWVTIAFQGDRPVSWVWSVDNTSGEDRMEKMRARSAKQRWLKLGWIATLPEVQHNGIATKAVQLAIGHSKLLQPVSAWLYPGELADGVMRRNGLSPISSSSPDILPNQPLPTRRYAMPTSKNKYEIARMVATRKVPAKLASHMHRHMPALDN